MSIGKEAGGIGDGENLKAWLEWTQHPIFPTIISPRSYYRQTAREIKRLDSISRSPIYDHFGEALSGAATIRALRQVRRFELISCLYMDGNQVQYGKIFA